MKMNEKNQVPMTCTDMHPPGFGLHVKPEVFSKPGKKFKPEGTFSSPNPVKYCQDQYHQMIENVFM